MDFEQVVRTTFAARDFTPEAIPDEALHRILDQARFAPSGGNRQGWHVIVVRSAQLRRDLAEMMQPVWRLYRAQVAAGENPLNTVVPSQVDPREAAEREAPFPLLDHLDDPARVPTLLVVTVDLAVVASMDKDLDRIGVISGASIYPFVWNILLAARNQGYGGVLTTFLAAAEPRAKRLLAVPDGHAIAAMVPLGRPVKQLSKLRRRPVEDFATWDRFDGEVFGAPGR
jgi:nitroreductase